MKSTSFFSNLFLSVWIVAHLIFCGIAALVLWGMLGMHFDSVHTSSTAMDPIYDLTRETVMENILGATLSWIFVVPVAGVIIYFLNSVFLEYLGKFGQRTALFLSLSCAAMLLGAIVLADVQCFLKYPQQ